MAAPGDDDEVEVGNGAESADAQGPDDRDEGADEASDDAAEHPDENEDDGEPQKIDAAPAAPAAPAESREERRVQRLANEAREAKESAEQARRELAEFRRQQQQNEQRLTAQQEQERLSLMTPEERTEYRLGQMQRTMSAQMQQMHMQSQLSADKTAFSAKAAVNPVYARHEAEVERKFDELLKQGKPVDRETLLKFILGERALAGADSGRAKAAKAGAKRVAAQRVAPSNAKGDTASQRGRTGQSAEDRLKGMFI